jgi:hypothetical protein
MQAITQGQGLLRATAFAIAPLLLLFGGAALLRPGPPLGTLLFAGCCALQITAIHKFSQLRAGALGWFAVLGIILSWPLLVFWLGFVAQTAYYTLNPTAAPLFGGR